MVFTEGSMELSNFLESVEKRAIKRTIWVVRDDDAAHDIVQDSMLRLFQNYAARPPIEWPLLFSRILSNTTMDWFRRQRVRNAVMQNMSDIGSDAGDGEFDLLESIESGAESAADVVSRSQTLLLIEEQVSALPARQREAFLLRYWEEYDIVETAAAMGCSRGSVTTHCFRAVHTLRHALRDIRCEGYSIPLNAV